MWSGQSSITVPSDKMSFIVDGSHRRTSCGEDLECGGEGGRPINY